MQAFFLVVLTDINWPGFPKDNDKAGVEYFTLSKVWPQEISLGNIEEIIENPLEGMFRQILGVVKEV